MFTHSTRFAPTPAAFVSAAEAQFQAAELRLTPELLVDWEQVARCAADSGFRCTLQFPNRLDVAQPALENLAKLYRALDCRTLVIHEPMFERHVGQILELDPSICLAVENSRFTPSRFESWAEDNEFLTLDVEHFWRFTLRDCSVETLLGELSAFLSTYGRKLRHVHLTGYGPGTAVHRPLYCGRDAVFAILSKLAEANFNGCVVSEVSEAYQNRRDLLMDSLLFESWQNRDELQTAGSTVE